jgi:precorrin-2 dehydrogenase/sirohydrochlorin ferrochelatase
MNFQYPVTLNLEDRRCVVIGGGRVAERKVQSLLAAGAKVWVIAPEATPLLQRLSGEQKITWVRNEYDEDCLEDSFLAVAATDRRDINNMISSDCRKRNILVNVVDSMVESDFIFNSFIQRGDLIIAVSTNGKSPALASKIKEELQEVYGPQYARLLDFLGDVRAEILRAVSGAGMKNKLLKEIVSSEIVDLVLEGRIEEAAEEVRQWLSQYSE